MIALALFRPSRRALTGTLLLALTAGVGGITFFKSQNECRAANPTATKEGPSALSVDVLTVSSRPLQLSIPATGTLMPKESIQLVSEVSRRLLRVHAKEGRAVTKGTVLFELDASMLRAQMSTLAVQHDLAKKTAARQKELLAESVGSQAEAEVAQAEEDALRTEMQRLAVEISKSTIQAPFDGVLGLRQVSEGAWVTPETPLITLEDTSELKVDFKVPERHASAVQLGSDFVVQVDGSAAKIQGKVIAMEPSVDVASRSLSVRGLLAKSDEAISGAFAKIEIPVTEEETIMVPAIAVLPSVAGRSVFVARDGKAQEVSVEVGVRTPDEVQILSGLKEGDLVILSNLLRLKDGAPVKVSSDG